MISRQQLIEHWTSGLADSEQQLVEGSSRFQWLRAMYARLYRFLIACYGRGEWRADEESAMATTDETASQMPFVDNTAHQSGAAPKSIDRIRATLESIHGSNETSPPQGPTRSLTKNSWMAVAASKDAQVVQRLRAMLSVGGIKARCRSRVTDHVLEVRPADFDLALQMVRETGAVTTSRSTLGASIRMRDRGAIVWLLFILLLAVLGAVIALGILTADEFLGASTPEYSLGGRSSCPNKTVTSCLTTHVDA